MTTMNRIRLTIVAVALLIAAISFSANQDASNADVSQSIVKVLLPGGGGSGFVVGENEIVTARHVAEDVPTRIRMLNGVEYEVLDILVDPNSDAAKLTVDANFPEDLWLDFDTTPREVGDEVVSVGYLLDFPLVRRTCTVCAVDCDVRMPRPWGNPNLDMIDRVIGPGPSGSPILLGRRVVGIYIIYIPQGGASFYVPAEEFVDDLKLR